MGSYIDTNIKPGDRKELRSSKRIFVEIMPIGDPDNAKLDAITSDMSDSGVALVTYIPLPVGTLVMINIDGMPIARGEVTHIDNWECCGLARMGVRFLEKSEDWPL
jgi:hypothetical protein